MRKLAALMLSFFFTTGVAFADTPKNADPKPAAPAKPKAAKNAPALDPAAVAAQLEELRQMMQSQQEEIQLLKEELAKRDHQIDEAKEAAASANSSAAAANSKASEAITATAAVKNAVDSSSASAAAQDTDLGTRVGKVEKDLDANKKEIKALSSLKMTGDLRLRFEPFWGGGTDAAPGVDRYRGRYRLRFNVNTKITDDIAAGLTLASGDLGDPISTNSSLTGFYTRKPIALDKAFGAYNPHYFKPLTVTGGKFAYTWQRTELTWDNDLNPEGVSEALVWDWKDKFLTHIGVIGYQTPFFEVSGGPDSYMTGGQFQLGLKVLPSAKLSFYVGYYDFANADTIAQNQAQTPGNGSATQGITNPGGGNFGFGANALTNNFGVINGRRVFASKFGILDTIMRLDLNTNSKRFPIYALFDYADNTRTCENTAAFVAAGVAPPTCDPNQKHAYWSEIQFGQTRNPRDFRLGYTFMRVERDAVVSAFNFSDMRQNTNVIEHRVEAFYQLFPRVTVGATGLIGRQIVTAQSPVEERWLKRWQFDTIFSF